MGKVIMRKRSGTNPLDHKQFERLRKSIEWSQKQLEFPRRKRIEGIKQLVGMHYMEGGYKKIMPINIVKLAVDVYVRQLAARAPRAMITTKQAGLKPAAKNFELAINQIPREIRLEDTLRRFVTEALFSMGVLKVGIASTADVLGHSYGEVFVDNVTMDDYFLDMSAKDMGRIQYEGNDYWLDFDDAMDSDLIEGEARDGLGADEYTDIGPSGEDRAEAIAGGSTAALFKDRLWLRDVWLPSEKLLVTYGVKSEKLFRIVEWEGPEYGPYSKLAFSDVPGNLLPLPPVAIWRDLNELANALLRKLGFQADAQKTVQGFPGGQDGSVDAFKNARDGDGINYTGAKPEKLEAGGIQQATLVMFEKARELSSYVAGNLDSIGGLAPMTQTVGQDKLLNEAANAQLRDMTAKTISAIKEIFYALAWYEWHDPIKSRMLEKKIPETDLSIPVKWGPDERTGDFDVYDLDIDVYSLQDDSPSAKLQKLGAIVSQYIIPLAPLIQQSSGVIDAQKILADVARFSDMDEVNEWVTFIDQPAGQEGQMPPTASGGASSSGGPALQQPQLSQSAEMTQELTDFE